MKYLKLLLELALYLVKEVNDDVIGVLIINRYMYESILVNTEPYLYQLQEYNYDFPTISPFRHS